jgi:hypothetical protein
VAELSISKRVQFSSGAQRRFLNRSMKQLKLGPKGLAAMLALSPRTIRDWQRESFTMSLSAVRFISKKLNQPIPRLTIKDPYWYAYIGSSAGGTAVYKKYGFVGGDPETRKKKWHEWWEREGRFKPHPFINVAKPIKEPKKSTLLAEFAGIVMGDGGITRRQVTVTLHHKDDKEYGEFVSVLIKKLFGVQPSRYHDSEDSVNNYVVSRSRLVQFCVEKLGLKIGNKVKQQIDIPDWIKQDKKFRIACVRGLVDTDGSVFTHTYKVNGKWYGYKKLDFSSMSQPLRHSVHEILKDIGFNPRFAQNKSVRLDSIADMKRYFQIINSHNPKHLRRYLN